MTEPLRLRTSVLIERAHACAAGFDQMGRKFSADLTRGFAIDMEAGLSPALYEHWIGQQEQLLASLSPERRAWLDAPVEYV